MLSSVDSAGRIGTPTRSRRSCQAARPSPYSGAAYLIATGRISSRRLPWSEEEDALLCELRAQRLSTAAMTKHFKDRTPEAVKRRTHQLRAEGRIGNLRNPSTSRLRWTDGEEARLIALLEDRGTVKGIAAQLPDRTVSAVEARVRELLEVEELDRAANSPLSRRPWSPEEDELLVVLRAADKTESEIASALDRTVASVSSRIRERVRKGEQLTTARSRRASRTAALGIRQKGRSPP